jgi:nitroimidazol reductase NimA-like FMN-containing flavoprotein (pyridoxamine 5'-phosphate oxidase superfamily)
MQITRPRPAVKLTDEESWELLAKVAFGRVVFTMNAMPAIRPVNHLVDNKMLIIRSHPGAAVVGHAEDDGAVVCYEADELDSDRHTGWSVIVTGTARLVHEQAVAARYRQLLEPWADGQMDHVISIAPHIITGIRLVGWCR